MKLKKDYFLNPDTLFLSRDLLGKIIHSNINGKHVAAIITETEAYLGKDDKACHAWNARQTPRNATMYEAGGVCYVYFCYGMHHLLNFVTNQKGNPHAILIRSIHVIAGYETVLMRRNQKKWTKQLTQGPGKVAQALGITLQENGLSLSSKTIWVEDNNMTIKEADITVGPRVGVEYADEHAKLPYRFSYNNIDTKK